LLTQADVDRLVEALDAPARPLPTARTPDELAVQRQTAAR